MNTAERKLANRVASGLAHCLPVTPADRELTCETCPYCSACEESGCELAPVRLPREMVNDIRKLVSYEPD